MTPFIHQRLLLSRLARIGGALLLLGAAASCTKDVKDVERHASRGDREVTDPDDADERDAWLHAYFGDDPTYEYLQYKAKIAKAEADKIAHRHHGQGNGREVMAAAVTQPAWKNLGPFAGALHPSNDATSADAAWRWLSWYQAHMDAAGFVTDYQVVEGRPVSTGDEDSTDAYSGTFLLAVSETFRATSDQARLPSLRDALGRDPVERCRDQATVIVDGDAAHLRFDLVRGRLIHDAALDSPARS